MCMDVGMAVPDYRARFIGQPATGVQHADADVEILAAARWGAVAKTGVEPAEPLQRRRAERHVGSRAEVAGRVGEQRLVGRRLLERIGAWKKALCVAGEALDEQLRGGL